MAQACPNMTFLRMKIKLSVKISTLVLTVLILRIIV